MSGFAGTGGEYNQFLQSLHLALTAQWGTDHVQYFGYGSQVSVVPPAQHGAWLQPAWYNHPVSLLHEPFAQVRPDRLSLMVTDLCPTKSDVAALTDAVRSHVVSRRLSLGILGLRGRFVGRVSCLLPWVPPFHYASTPDPATRRPYYLLAVGNPFAIVELIRELSRTCVSVQPQQLLLLGPHLLEKPLDWTAVESSSSDPLGAVVERSGIAKQGSRAIPFGEFAIREKRRPAHLILRLRIPAMPHAPRIQWQSPGLLSLSVWRSRGGFRHCTPQPAPEAEKHIRAELRPVEGDRVELRLTVDTRQLWTGTYLLRARLNAPAHVCELPPWCHQWSWNPDQQAPCLAQPAAPACNGTPFLLDFVRSVNTTMAADAGFVLGEIFLYMQR